MRRTKLYLTFKTKSQKALLVEIKKKSTKFLSKFQSSWKTQHNIWLTFISLQRFVCFLDFFLISFIFFINFLDIINCSLTIYNQANASLLEGGFLDMIHYTNIRIVSSCDKSIFRYMKYHENVLYAHEYRLKCDCKTLILHTD